MNNRTRRPTNRRPEQDGPKFCSRCGGATASQHTSILTNVCQCKREQTPSTGRKAAAAPEQEATAQVNLPAEAQIETVAAPQLDPTLAAAGEEQRA
jgi:hypothetical protein